MSKIKFKDWYILVQQTIALDAIERRYPEKKEREREGKKKQDKRKPYFRRAYRAVDDFFFPFLLRLHYSIYEILV